MDIGPVTLPAMSVTVIVYGFGVGGNTKRPSLSKVIVISLPSFLILILSS